jgi:prephenate dehydrogenase
MILVNIVVLGCGHMGSWLAREFSLEHRVAVYDEEKTRSVSGSGIVRLDRIEDIRGMGPDLLINAVTLQNTVAAFEAVVPFLPPGCILADVASIKARIADYYGKAGFRFVSVHPMFGPTFADMKSPMEENGVIISESCDEGRALFSSLFDRLGVRIFTYSFEEHDRMMAYSLTTPFLASLVFAACVDASAVPGTTFARHMALARKLLTEDDHLLAEILFNPYSLDEIAKITSRMEFLKHIIMARDSEEAGRFFGRLRENVGKEPAGTGEQ